MIPSPSAAGSGQVDDSARRDPRSRTKNERVLCTTTHEAYGEDLTDYYRELGVRIRYLHSDIDTLERNRHPPRPPPREFDVSSASPPSRGPRPPRGVARRDLRRRQGRLPPLAALAHPDHRTRGAQRERPRHHVWADTITKRDEERDRGDGPPAQASSQYTPTTDQPRYRRHAHQGHQSGQRPDRLLRRPEGPARRKGKARSRISILTEQYGALRAEMFTSAENLEFERAAKLRDELSGSKVSPERRRTERRRRRIRSLRVDEQEEERARRARAAPVWATAVAGSARRARRRRGRGARAPRAATGGQRGVERTFGHRCERLAERCDRARACGRDAAASAGVEPAIRRRARAAHESAAWRAFVRGEAREDVAERRVLGARRLPGEEERAERLVHAAFDGVLPRDGLEAPRPPATTRGGTTRPPCVRARSDIARA